MEQLEGYVERIIYQKAENGYTVLELAADEEDIVTCVGMLKGVTEGENLELQGEYVEHPLYGTQFKIVSHKVVAPKDRVSMERYLASGAIKGVGPALAKRIVKKFGDDTFRIMEREPERLAEIKGISMRIAQEIGVQMEEKRDLRDALVYLQQYGISNTLAVRIYDAYGMGLYKVMQENPYKLAEDITGVGFKIADEIAAKIGIHTDSDYRIRSGVLYTLLQAVSEGHCYLPVEELLERAAVLLEVDKEHIRPQIDNLMMDKKVIVKGINVYASSYYYAELSCAHMLHALNMPMNDKEEQIRTKIERITESIHMELDELQYKAVVGAIQNGLFILSGGPGTGKTTTINTIIRYFEREGLDIMLAAPTGRAAKRMTEATGFEAKTIHRLLEVGGAVSEEEKREVRFERNRDFPLETDVVIIDEMSMVDISLFKALLSAIIPGTRVIIVGDASQLPSVGPGQVLRDIMESGVFPMVVLEKIFRQAGESDIVVNAHRINKGQQIALDTNSKDFLFLERNDANVIRKHMIQLIQGNLPKYVNATPFDIQILTPMRKGALGALELNRILQEYLNPPAKDKREYRQGEVLLREGDKVMQIRNNYQLEWEIVSRYGIPVDSGLGVFNGDMGRILSINEGASEIMVEFDENRRVRYPFSLLEELELSYAITIHKSQGSEYPGVIMPLLSGPKMLMNRNLLYTGVTRAKGCVTILGSSETVRAMIDNESENKRYTSLRDRIIELA